MEANKILNIKQKKKTAMIVYWCLFAVLIALMVSMQQVFATDLFDAASKLAKEYFLQITALSTVVAACVIVTAFLCRMFSKNERTIAAWTNWAKVAVVSWLVITFLQVILVYAKDTISQYVGTASLW